MSDISLLVNEVDLSFPRHRVGLGSIFRWVKRRMGYNARIPPFDALKKINISISRGEVIGIIGRNGSGKSTLLRVMSGIYQPDKGVAMSSAPVNLLSNVKVGFNGNLSGRENVYLYGSILGHPREQMMAMMESIVSFAELEEFIDQPLRTYSSGMQARLGLSVASAVKPEILLIDEVLAVGDAAFKERSRTRIKEMVENASTVVIVSHNLNFLKKTCHKIILMDKGQIIHIGEPESAIKEYNDLISG